MPMVSSISLERQRESLLLALSSPQGVMLNDISFSACETALMSMGGMGYAKEYVIHHMAYPRSWLIAGSDTTWKGF